MGKHFKKTQKNKTISIMRIIFVILFIISAIKVIEWYAENRENKKISEDISKLITTDINNDELEKYQVNFEELKAVNDETVAFLKVNGTNIESVVVKGSNNEYYLTHNFEKNNNKAGWIFADYKNKFDGTDKNIVIYGHNRKDESMFGTLENILTEEWYSNEENQKIVFITENEKNFYEVFSVYQIKEEDYYIKNEFEEGEFIEYIKTAMERSITEFNVEVTDEDEILTLSTCADDDSLRIVLHAKKEKN